MGEDLSNEGRGSPVCSARRQCPRSARPFQGHADRGCERGRAPGRLPRGLRTREVVLLRVQCCPLSGTNCLCEQKRARREASDCRADGLLSTQVVVKQAKDSCGWWTPAALWQPVSLQRFPTLRTAYRAVNRRKKGEITRFSPRVVHRMKQRPREYWGCAVESCGNRVYHGRKKRPIATGMVRPATNTFVRG